MLKSQILALRAITSRFLVEMIKTYLIVAFIVFAILVGLVSWMSYEFTAWWLVFLLPIFFIGVPAFGLIFLAGSLATKVAPVMTKEQAKATKAYVRNLKEVSEGLYTSQLMIIFKVASDVIMKRGENGFIYNMTTKSASLKTDFEKLSKLFSNN